VRYLLEGVDRKHHIERSLGKQNQPKEGEKDKFGRVGPTGHQNGRQPKSHSRKINGRNQVREKKKVPTDKGPPKTNRANSGDQKVTTCTKGTGLGSGGGPRR